MSTTPQRQRAQPPTLPAFPEPAIGINGMPLYGGGVFYDKTTDTYWIVRRPFDERSPDAAWMVEPFPAGMARLGYDQIREDYEREAKPDEPRQRKRKRSIDADLRAAKRIGAPAATLPSGLRVDLIERPAATTDMPDDVEAWFKRHAH